MEKIIAPSILSADFKILGKEVEGIKESGAKWLHYDVMDGHFVNNISFGPYILKCISGLNDLVKDVHLMITDPLKYVDSFIASGADYITFHYEAINDQKEIKKLIDYLHSKNIKVGISVKPKTDPKVLDEFLKDIDLVLVMSVEPGFGGQKFDESVLSKVEYYNNYRLENNLNYYIEIDGGINDITSKMAFRSGCDILVCGSYYFNSDKRKELVANLLDF